MKMILKSKKRTSKETTSFFKKKNMIFATALTTCMSATPAIVLSTQLVTSSGPVTFNGQTFRNSNQLVNYIKENSRTKTYNSENSAVWQVKLNGKTLRYNSPQEMQSALSSYITTQTRVTSLSDEELEKFLDKKVRNVSDNEFYDDTQIGSDASTVASTTIYQGFSDIEYDTKDGAYKSYYEEKNAYYFNGMYFKSKEDLREYLKTDYLINNNKIQETKIIIQGPDGSKSAPINLSDSSALELIKSFIRNNVQFVVQYNGSNDETINLTKDNLESQYNSIAFNDLDYIHVNSSHGKQRYIIDNDIDDQHELIGPYLYNGNLDVSSFMDKTMWKKTTDVTNQVWQESKINTGIGTFFSSIINDDNSLNLEESKDSDSSLTIFRTLMAGSSASISLDEQYLQDLKDASASVYEDVMTSLNSLLRGKKGNTFFKIPVMYSLIMQKLINAQAKKEIINETISYFSKVCDYIQNALEIVILDKSLLINDSGETFNVKTLFQIGNNEFNLNTNVEYFIEKIKQWPKLVTAMIIYNEAINNLNMMGGLIPFSGNDNSFLFDFSLISEKDYEENIEIYKKIYETFSQTNYSSFVKLFVQNSQLPKIVNIKNKYEQNKWEEQLDKTEFYDGIILSTFLKTVIVKNTMEYNVAKAALEAEIENYKKDKTIIEDGMLSQLGKGLDSFINGIGDGTQVDVYQVYLALIADMRSGGRVLGSSDKLSNPTTIIKNVSYFATSILSSVALVSDLINKLYWKSDSVTWQGLTTTVQSSSKLFKPLKNSIKSVYSKVSNALPKLKSNLSRTNSFVLSASTFNPLKISSSKFFVKLNSFVDMFKAAAPVLGSAFFLLQIGLLAYDLFSSTTKTIYYVYTASDGTQFIWDGGEMVSRYLGFETTETSTIDNMKLLKPVQFTLGQIEEYYYYDGVKYFDRNDLKTVQMNYIFSDNYKNENKHFKKKYSFDKSGLNQLNQNVFNSVDEVIDSVLNDLGITLSSNKSKIQTVNLNRRSPYFVDSVYSFSSGLLTSFEESVDVISKNILSNIRATKIVRLPNIKNGYSDGTKPSEALVIPGMVWTKNGMEDNTSQASKYIIDNSANDTNGQITDWSTVTGNNFKITDPVKAETNASSKLYDTFKSKFQVPSKKIMNFILANNNINSNNLYSTLSSDSRVVNTYIVSIPGRQSMTFLDLGKALNYVSVFADAKKVVTSSTSYTSYQYNDLFFATDKELREWVSNLSR